MKALLPFWLILFSWANFSTSAQTDVLTRLIGYNTTKIEIEPSCGYFFNFDSAYFHYSDNRDIYVDQKFRYPMLPVDTLGWFIGTMNYIDYKEYFWPDPIFTTDYNPVGYDNYLAYDDGELYDWMMDSQVIASQIHKSYDAENISSVSTSWYGYSPDIDNYIYNASGKLISLIETYDDWLSGAEIDYDTNFADYYYYDSDRLTKFQNNYYNYEYEDPDEIPSISTSEYNYEYDDAGNIVAKKYFEYYSQDSSSLEYEYSGGHLTMIRTNYQDDGVWQPTDTIELEYSGNLLTKVTFSNSENPSVRPYNKYSYNADGLIDSISKYRTWYDGLKLISFEKFEYNENRQLEFYTFYPSLLNTEVSYSIDYDYDQNSRLIEMYEYENDYDYDYGSYAAFTWNDDGTVHTREVGANRSTEYPYESWNGGSGRTEYYVTQYYYEKIVADPAGSVENGFYIHVYPSPANSNINILFVNAEGDIDVEIRDVLGRLVYNAADLSAEMKQLSIDVSTFEPGVYFVTVDSNGNTSTQSIVVK